MAWNTHQRKPPNRPNGRNKTAAGRTPSVAAAAAAVSPKPKRQPRAISTKATLMLSKTPQKQRKKTISKVCTRPTASASRRSIHRPAPASAPPVSPLKVQLRPTPMKRSRKPGQAPPAKKQKLASEYQPNHNNQPQPQNRNSPPREEGRRKLIFSNVMARVSDRELRQFIVQHVQSFQSRKQLRVVSRNLQLVITFRRELKIAIVQFQNDALAQICLDSLTNEGRSTFGATPEIRPGFVLTVSWYNNPSQEPSNDHPNRQPVLHNNNTSNTTIRERRPHIPPVLTNYRNLPEAQQMHSLPNWNGRFIRRPVVPSHEHPFSSSGDRNSRARQNHSGIAYQSKPVDSRSRTNYEATRKIVTPAKGPTRVLQASDADRNADSASRSKKCTIVSDAASSRKVVGRPVPSDRVVAHNSTDRTEAPSTKSSSPVLSTPKVAARSTSGDEQDDASNSSSYGTFQSMSSDDSSEDIQDARSCKDVTVIVVPDNDDIVQPSAESPSSAHSPPKLTARLYSLEESGDNSKGGQKKDKGNDDVTQQLIDALKSHNADLLRSVERLTEKVSKLREEKAELHQKNIGLQNETSELREGKSELHQRVAELESRVEEAQTLLDMQDGFVAASAEEIIDIL